MENLDTGLEIYSITIGLDQKDGMRWTIGTKVGKDKEMTISVIAVDDVFYIKYGILSYVIYVNYNGSDMLWRRYTEVPNSIVYKI